MNSNRMMASCVMSVEETKSNAMKSRKKINRGKIKSMIFLMNLNLKTMVIGAPKMSTLWLIKETLQRSIW